MRLVWKGGSDYVYLKERDKSRESTWKKRDVYNSAWAFARVHLGLTTFVFSFFHNAAINQGMRGGAKVSHALSGQVWYVLLFVAYFLLFSLLWMRSSWVIWSVLFCFFFACACMWLCVNVILSNNKRWSFEQLWSCAMQCVHAAVVCHPFLRLWWYPFFLTRSFFFWTNTFCMHAPHSLELYRLTCVAGVCD